MWLPFQKLHPLGYAGEYMTAGACTHKCRAFGLVFSSMTHKFGNSFWNALWRHQKGFIPEVWRTFHKFHPSGYARAHVRAVVNTFEWEALGLVFLTLRQLFLSAAKYLLPSRATHWCDVYLLSFVWVPYKQCFLLSLATSEIVFHIGNSICPIPSMVICTQLWHAFCPPWPRLSQESLKNFVSTHTKLLSPLVLSQHLCKFSAVRLCFRSTCFPSLHSSIGISFLVWKSLVCVKGSE